MLKRFLSLIALLLFIPVAGLGAPKIADASFTPSTNAVSYSFIASGQDYVHIIYKTAQESGKIVVEGESGYFSGELPLPLTYAGNNVNITLQSLSGSKLGQFKTKTAYPSAMPPKAPAESGPLSGITVCIDPGHQLKAKGGKEPLGPGLKGTKSLVIGMAEGAVTKRTEAAVVLEIGLQLRDLLMQRGANVVMTRDVMDKTLTNLERAAIANDAGADITLRLHGNSNSSSKSHGIIIYGPSQSDYAKAVADNNTYLAWARTLLNSMLETTDADRGNAALTNRYVGSNWCKMPVFLVEMGYMSNPQDDLLLSDPAYQQKLCLGMADGIEAILKQQGRIK